jgi:pimeloyl-ACP methyl ester carboxylesterase
MPYMNQEGYQIYFDITGKGIPVITMHGLIENGSYWGRTGISAAIAEAGFCVIDMDMRGHGRSVPNGINPDYRMEAIMADIGALADFLKVERFHLLTHATGGMAGVRYAMKHHDRLLSLISTDTASMTLRIDEYKKEQISQNDKSCKRGDAMSKYLLDSGSFHQIISDLRKDLSGHIFGPFFRGFLKNRDPERCWRWTEEIYELNNIAYCADFARGFAYDDPNPRVDELRKISCPSLLMVGEYDSSLIKPMEIMARNIQNVEHHVLEGLGHMIAIEDPMVTKNIILSFLKKI